MRKRKLRLIESLEMRLPMTSASAYVGDLNNDGVVNFEDFLSVSREFGSEGEDPMAGDTNGDGRVDFQDFLTISSNFGRSFVVPDFSPYANVYPDAPAAVTGYYEPGIGEPIAVSDDNLGSVRSQVRNAQPGAQILLTPETIHLMPTLLTVAAPGVHFVLSPGRYDVERMSIRGISGTEDHPIVIRALERGEAIFMPSDWTGGAHGAILDLKGHHFVIDGLHFSSEASYETDSSSPHYKSARFSDGHYRLEAGRLLNISSSPNAGVSHHVSVINSFFTNSWRHALVAQGNDLTFDSNVFRDNLNYNFEHTRASWPFVVGNWWYYAEEGQPSQVNMRPVFINNQVYHNHGEGIHSVYSDGTVIRNNYVADNLFVNIALNMTRNATVEDNLITTVDPLWTRFGNGTRAIRLWMEVTGDSPWVTIENAVVRNNWIFNQEYDVEGQSRSAISVGIQLAQQALARSLNIPDHTFRDVAISRNQIFGEIPIPYEIQCVPSNGDVPSGNTIDLALSDPSLQICTDDLGGYEGLVEE